MAIRTFTADTRIPYRWRAMRRPSTPLSTITPMFFGAREGRDLEPKTVRSYRDQFAQFDAWCEARTGKPATLADLEPITVNAFVGHRLKHGVRAGVKGSEHQGGKAATALRSLGTWMANNLLWYDTLGGSVLGHKTVLIPLSDAERATLTIQDFARVLAATDDTAFPERDRTILLLLAGNGPREKELVSLRLQHYDRIEGVITIPAKGTKGRRGYRKPRAMELDDIVRPEVDRYIERYRIGPEHPEAALFTTRTGQPFTENGLYQLLKRIKIATGIEALCPHALRHYWASHFDGTTIELMHAGGWKTLSQVQRYCKPTQRRNRESTIASALALGSKRRSPIQGEGLRVVRGDRRDTAV